MYLERRSQLLGFGFVMIECFVARWMSRPMCFGVDTACRWMLLVRFLAFPLRLGSVLMGLLLKCWGGRVHFCGRACRFSLRLVFILVLVVL